MTRHVYVYHSGQSGAPSITAGGTAGQLHDIIYACGVTGFGSVTLDSLTQTAGVATATRAAGLSLADGYPALYTNGPPSVPIVISISGSSNGWDGEYELNAVPGATTCTFTCPSNLPSPATGTITLKRAPAGMTRLSNASNKSVWQFKDTAVCPGYLMLDDSNAQYAGVRLAETAANPVDYTTMTGLCPTVAQQAAPGAYWNKTSGSGAAKSWILVIWNGGLYFMCAWNASFTTQFEVGYAGACLSRKAADEYPGIVIGNTASGGTRINNYCYIMAKNGGSQMGQWVQRASSQIGSAIAFTKIGSAFGLYIGGVVGAEQSNIVEGGADEIHGPIHICEGAAAATVAQRDRRGIMPGLWDPLCSSNRATLDVLYGMSNLSSRRVGLIRSRGDGNQFSDNFLALDLDGPYALTDY